jgi:hypothetical protein
LLLKGNNKRGRRERDFEQWVSLGAGTEYVYVRFAFVEDWRLNEKF